VYCYRFIGSKEFESQPVLSIKRKMKICGSGSVRASPLEIIGKVAFDMVEKSDELIRYTTNFRPHFFIKYPNIRIVTAIDPPFISSIPMYKDKCHGRRCLKYVENPDDGSRTLTTFCCVGLCIDLMIFLETDMKAKFELWLGMCKFHTFLFTKFAKLYFILRIHVCTTYFLKISNYPSKIEG